MYRESVWVKMVELLQQVESNLTQVLLARTVLKDLTAIPILGYSLKDKNIYRIE
jgi:Kef-type K+ transport system membrane component KefB